MRIPAVQLNAVLPAMMLFGSEPGRMTPARGPQPVIALLFAVIVRHWSWNGT